MIPPGIISGTEIFTAGENLLAMSNGKTYTWPHFPSEVVVAVENYLTSEDPKAFHALEHLPRLERLFQYMSCRFGAYDATPDICGEGVVTPDKKVCNCADCPLSGVHSNVAGLTKREIDVLKLITSDTPAKNIADLLYLSIDTVKTHKKNIYRKTGKHTNVALTRWAVENDIS